MKFGKIMKKITEKNPHRREVVSFVGGTLIFLQGDGDGFAAMRRPEVQAFFISRGSGTCRVRGPRAW